MVYPHWVYDRLLMQYSIFCNPESATTGANLLNEGHLERQNVSWLTMDEADALHQSISKENV